MKTVHWEQVKQVLAQALEQSPEDRQAYLDSACGSDTQLRAEVESLITSHEQAGSQFLAQAAGELLHLSSATEPQPAVEQMIGPYRLRQEIGRGGMGQVWLAEQTEPVCRQVALKLVRIGMYDPEVLRRFHWERQSLALMDHPSIAKIFDAGTTPQGQPYFAMEYVPGVPITDYCDQKQLKIADRLQLFVTVCEAVQHAHQKAIIHRDLKPANILVQEIDGKAAPRIIDFGLAKALEPQMTEQSLYTRMGSFVGTPGYMSPEQCHPAGQDVDTRSDVYSLGVVLYVLLTGSLPFGGNADRQSVHEVLRRVREEDPPRPSARIAKNRQASSASAQVRSTNPEQLASALRGDLDWIAMKALDRDRAQRYGTAAELGADVERYLNHEPVSARAASVSYRLLKYVRRHRVGVAAASFLVVILAAFAVMQMLQLRRTTRERDRADRIADFMTGIFKVADPTEKTGSNVTARELLDKASNQIDTGLAKDPQLQAEMMYVMGRAYMNLGLYSRSQSLLERSIAISNSSGQQRSRTTFKAIHDLGWDLLQQGKLADSEKLQRKLLESTRKTLGPDDPETLSALGILAYTLCEEGNCSEGAKLNRELLEKQTRILGPEAYYTLVTRDNLAIALAKSGHLSEAEALLTKTLEIRRRVWGPENLVTIDSMVNLADVERDLGRDEAAQKLFEEALGIEVRVFAPDQPELAGTRYDFACLLAHNDRADEALALLQQAVDHGLPPRDDLGIADEPYFRSLRDDPRFTALVEHAKQRAKLQTGN
ncbi:MAG TPA: tetratricopeptide repeat protein [Terriglobales bacterium]